MRPLRRAKLFRSLLVGRRGRGRLVGRGRPGPLCRRFDLPLPRRQVRRRDASGRWRYTDAEWSLADGTLLVLEVDGAFHMDVSSWEDDIARSARSAGRAGSSYGARLESYATPPRSSSATSSRSVFAGRVPEAVARDGLRHTTSPDAGRMRAWARRVDDPRQKTLSGRNCTDRRGPAWATFGIGVLPGALAGAAHHDQVAVAHLDRDRLAAAARAQGQPARVADRDDRDHGVLGPAAADGVAVPGDAVAAVAVVAAAGGHERLAQLGEVVRRERVAGLGRGSGGGAGRRRRTCARAGVRRPPGRTSAGARPATARRATRVANTSSALRQPVAAYVDPGAAGQRAGARARRGPARPPGRCRRACPGSPRHQCYARIEQMFDAGLGDVSGVRQGRRAAIPGGTRSVLHGMLAPMTVTTPPSATGYAARVRNLTKTYGTGQALVTRARRRHPRPRRGRVHRGDGAERVGQVDADALLRGARHRRLRRRSSSASRTSRRSRTRR